MADFLLVNDQSSPHHGDLDFTEGKFSLVTGREEITQRLRIKLNLVMGEYTYDRSKGTDWYGKILGQRNMVEVDAELRRAILSTAGIARLAGSIQYNRDKKTRVLTASFVAITVDDEEIEMIT